MMPLVDQPSSPSPSASSSSALPLPREARRWQRALDHVGQVEIGAGALDLGVGGVEKCSRRLWLVPAASLSTFE
jgi:hypothetical protein